MDLDLDSRVFIVTGGSRGLGRATARVLVDEGARVLLVGRDADSLAAVEEALPGAVTLAGSLDEPDLAARAVALALEHFGRVDGALISGGGPAPGTALTVSDSAWREAFETVFLGGLRMAREVLNRPTPTTVAWVLSTSAVEVFSGLAASNGLRPGLAMLVKDLADEVAARGSRVVGLLPGRMATDRIAALDAAAGPEAADRARRAIPLQRYGTPEEFGRVAAFLLSPAASYVTGTLITVDGGLTRQP